jgi:hypothetical protein
MSSIQLHVSLVDTKPSIWRRIIVPAATSAYEFHYMVQIAMGWKSHHLFEFRYGSSRLSIANEWGDVVELGKGTSDIEKVTVEEMAGAAGSTFSYLYDFGDDWLHKIVVEEFRDEEINHAICSGGELACPPEDCGGIPGYYNLLKILKNKIHKERPGMVSWLNKYNPNWDKDRVDLDAINRELSGLRTCLKLKKKRK